MKITNVYRNSAIELRFTIIDGDREMVRMIFVGPNETPTIVAEKMADNINAYMEMKAAGFPHDYNQEEHIAGILADTPRYGCD